MDEKYSLTAAEEKSLQTFLNRRLGADLDWITTVEGRATTMKTQPLSTAQIGILSHIFARVQYDLVLTPSAETPERLALTGEIRAHWEDWQGGMNGLGTGVYITLQRRNNETFRIREEAVTPTLWEDE